MVPGDCCILVMKNDKIQHYQILINVFKSPIDLIVCMDAPSCLNIAIDYCQIIHQ